MVYVAARADIHISRLQNTTPQDLDAVHITDDSYPLSSRGVPTGYSTKKDCLASQVIGDVVTQGSMRHSIHYQKRDMPDHLNLLTVHLVRVHRRCPDFYEIIHEGRMVVP